MLDLINFQVVDYFSWWFLPEIHLSGFPVSELSAWQSQTCCPYLLSGCKTLGGVHLAFFFGWGWGSWWKSHELRMMQENTWKRLVHCISVCGTLILKILPSFIHLFNMWSGHLLWLGTLSDAEDTDEKKADKVLGRRRQSISREPRLVWRVTCFFYL